MKPIIHQNDGLSFQLDKKNFTATVINSPNAKGDIFFPRSIQYQSQEYIITSIGKNFLKTNYNVYSVSFSDDSELRTICNKAFSDSSIESITIPSKVDTIEDGWCKKAVYLNSIYLSPQNKNFKYLDDNQKIIVGKSNPNNEKYDVIYISTNDELEITIPSQIKEIRPYSFCHSKLKKVFFEKDSKLRRIGREAFNQPFLSYVEIPASVEQLEDGCFTGIRNLSVIVHPDNKNYKNLNNFVAGKSDPKSAEFDVIIKANFLIDEIVIPSSIKIIDSFAFSNCFLLKKIEFEKDSKLTTIGKQAFSFTLLNKITIPENVTYIGKGAFNSCSFLKSIEFHPNSKLKTIPKNLFENNGIENFTIPMNIEKFADGWNKGSFFLNALAISEKNQNFSYLDDKKKIIIAKSDLSSSEFDVIVFANKDLKHVFIPSTIKFIMSYAFYNCTRLESVEFSDDIKIETFEEGTFERCIQLSSIKIPSTIKYIESRCFFLCNQLKTFEIHPDSQLLSIGAHTFFQNQIDNLFLPPKFDTFSYYWQTQLEFLVNITISPENKHFKYLDDEHKIIIGKYESSNDFDVIVFACHDIKKAFIPSYIKYISPNAFNLCKNLVEIEFDKNSQLLTIENNAFCHTGIEKISIPSHVKFICKSCFFKCPNLKKIDFEKNSELEIFSDMMFLNDNIESITIPSKVRTLKKDWCDKIKNVKEVIIQPNSDFFSFVDNSHKLVAFKSNEKVDVFDVLAFVCRDVKEVVIPESIKMIGPNAFSSGQIQRVFIPSSVRSIGYKAFCQCSQLKSVEFDDNSELESISDQSFVLSAIERICFPRKIKEIDMSNLIMNDEIKNIEFLGDEISIHKISFLRCSLYSFPNARKVIIDEKSFPSYFKGAFLFFRPNVTIVINPLQ